MSPKRPENERPRIAISVGEGSGVGPELALKCAALREVTDRCVPILWGTAGVLQRVAKKLQLSCPPVRSRSAVRSISEPVIIDVGGLDCQNVVPGQFNAATGAASYQAVVQAVAATLAGEVAAIVTGPIQKEAWHLAGIAFPGHTELLGQQTGCADYCMMLTSETISCVLATIHIPLADVPSRLSTAGVVRAIRLGAAAARRRLGRSPHVTVCGLNPHAGENGLISHGEEQNIITPAIELARNDGIDVVGPLPPDTAFTPHLREQTDVYICMYHDQGLIPLKALSFDDAVNVTLGLPIVRTSVDHGTALDIAWQGTASHRSMLAAIGMAIDLC
jgi:4-hydroxythreonine-4-phosphate dehydrogenase